MPPEPPIEEADPILPIDLLPAEIGVAWGWTSAHCDSHWAAAPTYVAEGLIRLSLPIAGKLREVECFFADPTHREYHIWHDGFGQAHDWSGGATGLFCMRTCLYRSQFFFEDDLDGEDVYDILARVWEEYEQRYARLVACYTEALGAPVFSGGRYLHRSEDRDPANDDGWVRNPAFPAGQWESPLTYWTHPAGRLQIGLHHEDKELPIEIWLSCWPSGRNGKGS